jgi:hypothetical protein
MAEMQIQTDGHPPPCQLQAWDWLWTRLLRPVKQKEQNAGALEEDSQDDQK